MKFTTETIVANSAQLYGILNKRAIETSKMLAKKAQLSTNRMEVVTDSMYEIAKKTQQETVSMKIITLVTLFFLPGTFISVSNSDYPRIITRMPSDLFADGEVVLHQDDHEYRYPQVPEQFGEFSDGSPKNVSCNYDSVHGRHLCSLVRNVLMDELERGEEGEGK
jgi:hypothetical protein